MLPYLEPELQWHIAWHVCVRVCGRDGSGLSSEDVQVSQSLQVVAVVVAVNREFREESAEKSGDGLRLSAQ